MVQHQGGKQKYKIFGKNVSPYEFLAVVAIEDVRIHFGQSAEDIILLRLFGKKKQGTYVDIGSFHPRKYSNTFILHHFFGWSGINVDASSESIELFNMDRPNDINIHSAVGEKTEVAAYWKFNYPARNTISSDNVNRQLSKGDAAIVGEETVAVRTLADILNENLEAGKEIDLLNIDVEGVEMQVLRSNDWRKYKPKVILVEDYSVRNLGLACSNVFSFLSDIGYKFIAHTYDTSVYALHDFQDMTEDSEGFQIDTGFWKERAAIISKSHPDIKEALKMNKNHIDKEEEYIKLISDLELRIEEWGRSSQMQQKSYEELAINSKMQLKFLQDELKEKRERNREYSAEIRKNRDIYFQVNKKYKGAVKERNRLRKLYIELKNSRTWKITAPIRVIFNKFRRL